MSATRAGASVTQSDDTLKDPPVIYPQLRDNEAQQRRELWIDERTLHLWISYHALFSQGPPTGWHLEWRLLWRMPPGTYTEPYHIKQRQATRLVQ